MSDSVIPNPGHTAKEISIFVQEGNILKEMNFQEAIDKALLCPNNPELFNNFQYDYKSIPSPGHVAKEVFINAGGYQKNLQGLIVDKGFCSNNPPDNCDIYTKLMENCGECSQNVRAGECCAVCNTAFICYGTWKEMFPTRTSCN